MENVKGMLNKIDEILDDFGNILKREYKISYSILNAKDFGIPQNRERLFVIGNNIGVDIDVLFERINEYKLPHSLLRKPFLTCHH